MSCILRISGEALDIDALLAQHELSPDRVWKKGDTRALKGKVHSDSGATFVVSDADLDEFATQLKEAMAYLETHVRTIAEMVASPGVQFAVLDFGVSLRKGYVAQFCSFSSTFIQLLASSGVSLEVSHYACSDDAVES